MKGKALKGFVLFFLVLVLSVPQVMAQEPCYGNFDCDQDVDADDVTQFLSSFGRNDFFNPCPTCQDSPCPCTPPGCDPPAQVEKTGQTTAYATGDDGDLERGVTWPNPRFTDNADGTVTDTLTGLVWLKDANCFGERMWSQALSDCSGLSDGLCGLSDNSSPGDWNCPNRNELNSLVHSGFYDPTLSDTAGTGPWSEGDPFTNVQSNFYWTSTTTPSFSGAAYEVTMELGTIGGRNKTGVNYIWPVRGGQ
jgi:hypothetical protein